MPRITIVIEDITDPETQQDGVTLQIAAVDPQGRPKGSPDTGALLTAMAIQRLWRHRVLAPLSALVCDDRLLLQRPQQPVQVPRNLAQAAAPDKEGATDVKAVEVQAPAPSGDGTAAPEKAAAGE